MQFTIILNITLFHAFRAPEMFPPHTVLALDDALEMMLHYRESARVWN